MTRNLPDFLRNMLNAPPRAGEGVHIWMFKVAQNLHAHLPVIEIVNLIESRLANCGRRVPRSEIVAAVQNSIPYAWRPGGHDSAPAPAPRRWPEVIVRLRREIVTEAGGLADLWESSPMRMDSNAPRCEEFIDALFPGNPLLCCGRSSSEFDTRPREDWRGELVAMQFIVPSPMSALAGLTKDGRESAHCLNNTGPRRFLVVEQDKGTEDEQAGILLHLAEHHAPLTLVVHSGGKSLHGWFFCAGRPEEKLESFFRNAVTLGADPAIWTKSQFVRMPGGQRDNGRRQVVYYFNSGTIKS